MLNKYKKRIFEYLVLLFLFISIFTIMGRSADRPTTYGTCLQGTYVFISSYDYSFNCNEIDSELILKSTNNAITDLQSCIAGSTYKEAYVSIWNANGTQKSDTRFNSTVPTVDAEVNPILFTPVRSLHKILCYETEGYMMHSYAFN